MSNRTQYIVTLMTELQQRWREHDPFDREVLDEEEQDFSEQWQHAISQAATASPNFQFDAQELVARFIRCYPHLVPLMKRELLWFLGGECLHYLGDEEIAFYEVLEEELYQYDSQEKDYDISQVINSLKATPTSIQ